MNGLIYILTWYQSKHLVAEARDVFFSAAIQKKQLLNDIETNYTLELGGSRSNVDSSSGRLPYALPIAGMKCTALVFS